MLRGEAGKSTTKMNVLSLFDGMSCGRIALERAGIPVTKYYICEINPIASKVAGYEYLMHKNSIRVALDVKDLSYDDGCLINSLYNSSFKSKIHLLIAGSPCQGFSKEGTHLNFEHPGSILFFEFVRILKEIREDNPSVLFFLENVWMKKEWADVITKMLGVNPIMIDSQLVSAQKRRRLYWTNIPDIEQPKDTGIKLQDVLINTSHRFWNEEPIENFNLSGLLLKRDGFNLHIKEATKQGFCIVKPGDCFDANFPASKTRRGRLMSDKSNCITATKQKWYQYVRPGYLRELTINDLERLQGLKDDYTCAAPINSRFEMVGNGWEINTITHIFKNIPK